MRDDTRVGRGVVAVSTGCPTREARGVPKTFPPRRTYVPLSKAKKKSRPGGGDPARANNGHPRETKLARSHVRRSSEVRAHLQHELAILRRRPLDRDRARHAGRYLRRGRLGLGRLGRVRSASPPDASTNVGCFLFVEPETRSDAATSHPRRFPPRRSLKSWLAWKTPPNYRRAACTWEARSTCSSSPMTAWSQARRCVFVAIVANKHRDSSAVGTSKENLVESKTCAPRTLPRRRVC